MSRVNQIKRNLAGPANQNGKRKATWNNKEGLHGCAIIVVAMVMSQGSVGLDGNTFAQFYHRTMLRTMAQSRPTATDIGFSDFPPR